MLLDSFGICCKQHILHTTVIFLLKKEKNFLLPASEA